MGKLRVSDGIDLHYGGVTEGGAALTDGSRNLTVATGASAGKFAVMSSAVHGSYDFYNNGTSYFNSNVIVDANLTLSGGGQILGSPAITAGRVVTSGLYGTGHGSSILPIWQYNAGNPGYGIGYYEGNPDTIRFDASSNLMSGTPDFEISSNIAKVNGNTVWHAGNDGPNSGLNADLLDNLHGSSYMRLDAAQDVTNYTHVHSFYTNGNIATSSGSQSSLQCYNNTQGNDAFMTFHIGSDFACYFGLDGGTNKLSVGGWSMGANSYEIYHSGNKPSLAALGFTGASNANYITNNNQLTNGAGYTTNVGDVTSVTADAPLGVSNGGGPNPHIVFSSPSITTSTSNADGDFFLVHSGTTNSGNLKKLTKGNINISGFNNDSSYITTSAIGTYIGKNRPNNYVASSTSTSNRGNFGEGIWAYSGYSTGTNRPFTYDATLQVMPDSSLGFELSVDWVSQGTTPIKIRSLRDCCQGWSSYSTIWTSSTDGPNSGLDADLLDSLNAKGVGSATGASQVLTSNTNSYFVHQNWIDIGSSGIYSTSTNGAHFRPNGTTSYGTWATSGSKNGYDGIVFDAGGDVAVMFDSAGNGGFFDEGNRWFNYHHVGNACTAFNASTTSSSYTIYSHGGIYSTGDVVAYSDRRAKENIITIDSALEKVNQLRGVYYNKIDNEDKEREIGFIAQEVNEVAPELVTYAEDIDQYGVKYGNTTALLVEAVKELTQQVKDLKQEIEEIKNVK